MVQTEMITTKDGRTLVKTFSDMNRKIIQNGTGKVYVTAIDPIEADRTYTESEEEIKKAPEKGWRWNHGKHNR